MWLKSDPFGGMIHLLINHVIVEQKQIITDERQI
jgi:hypothetical protein